MTEAICSIEGCGRGGKLVRGFCNRHYLRFRRHGDPLGGASFRDGTPVEFLQETVLPYGGDDCLIWPFAKDSDGYPKVGISGKDTRVGRYICEKLFGPPPSPTHQAAHSCGNGHLSCVTPAHLRWASYRENQLDRHKHGTMQRGKRHWKAKLTPNAVRYIRSRHPQEPIAALAKRFRVTPSAIDLVIRRKNWAWLDP